MLVPGAALQAVDDDVLVEQAVGDLAAGALDRVGLGVVAGPGAEGAVGARAGELDEPVGAGQLEVHRAAGEREVLQGPLGVRPVQAGAGTGTSPSRSRSTRRSPLIVAGRS